jgi:hypothetical protein
MTHAPTASARTAPARLSPLGLLLSCIPSSRGALGAGQGLSFAMMMLSVTGPPPEVFTDVTRWVANVLPLTYVVRVLQDPWLPLTWNVVEVAVVLGVSAGAVMASVLTFKGSGPPPVPRRGVGHRAASLVRDRRLLGHR